MIWKTRCACVKLFCKVKAYDDWHPEINQPFTGSLPLVNSRLFSPKYIIEIIYNTNINQEITIIVSIIITSIAQNLISMTRENRLSGYTMSLQIWCN